MKRVLIQVGKLCVWGCVATLLLLLGIESWVRLAPYQIDDSDQTIRQSARFLDRHGRLLREAVGPHGHRAIYKPFDKLSDYARAATIAVEDHRFYEHSGIDTASVARAAVRNIITMRIVSGASTLTMQLARLLHPRKRGFASKFLEAIDARRIEYAANKQWILAQYLNRAPYGAGTIGLEAASLRYFGKPNTHLSLAEAALLAGLPKAPTRLNPLRAPASAKQRQRHVLRRMLKTGAISDQQYQRALTQPLSYETNGSTQVANHFTHYIHTLAQQSGRINTSLDLGLHQQVARIVGDHVASLAETGTTNAAAIVLDNRRCEILAMVGSANYFAQPNGMVNGTRAKRQPGSTLKPFAYALAFEQGASPTTIAPDIETHYGRAQGRLFSPRNYHDDYAGPVTLGAALGRSLNIPAIYVAKKVGVAPLLSRLRRTGFSSLSKSPGYYGLGLVLGNGEVTLLELAQSYAMFARQGLRCDATPFASPETVRAAQPQQPDDTTPHRVFSSDIAFLVTNILSNEHHRVSAFGPSNALLLGYPVAVKTGTSANWRDNWAIGYTERYTVAVWNGDFANKSMNQLAGASGAGPLFSRIMNLVIEHYDAIPQAPSIPDSIVKTHVCALSGQRPNRHCPHQIGIHLRETDVPRKTCTWHARISIDIRNGDRAGPGCPDRHVDHQVVERLPQRYASWVATHPTRSQAGPTRYSEHCPQKGPVSGVLSIRYPRNGEVFIVEPGYDRTTQTVELLAETSADRPVIWAVNGKIIAKAPWPHTASWQLKPGHHTITASTNGLVSDAVTIEVR